MLLNVRYYKYLYYDRIVTSKKIDLTKRNNSKECIICHY